MDALITDPVWPNAVAELAGSDRAIDLFREMWDSMSALPKRAAIILGCDSDPAILASVPLPFVRVCYLRLALPHPKGRILYSGDVAYLYGEPPKSVPGHRVMPGEHTASRGGKEANHPCPRKLQHMRWLVAHWTREGETILDPFAGSGTTLVAAQDHGRAAVGIEIEPRHVATAQQRLSARCLF